MALLEELITEVHSLHKETVVAFPETDKERAVVSGSNAGFFKLKRRDNIGYTPHLFNNIKCTPPHFKNTIVIHNTLTLELTYLIPIDDMARFD